MRETSPIVYFLIVLKASSLKPKGLRARAIASEAIPLDL